MRSWCTGAASSVTKGVRHERVEREHHRGVSSQRGQDWRVLRGRPGGPAASPRPQKRPGTGHPGDVRELKVAERDRIYAEQARRYPGYAEYPRRTAGIRTIPVLELRRA